MRYGSGFGFCFNSLKSMNSVELIRENIILHLRNNLQIASQNNTLISSSMSRDWVRGTSICSNYV